MIPQKTNANNFAYMYCVLLLNSTVAIYWFVHQYHVSQIRYIHAPVLCMVWQV